MRTTNHATLVIVPGLREHVDNHWQTILAAESPNARTVPPSSNLSLDERLTALDQTLSTVPGRAILVAHSAGVLTTVHWAQRHPNEIRITGALLATPPNLDTALPTGYPAQHTLAASGWTPTPRRQLPFPSIVAASSNDPLADPGDVADLAASWGSRLIDLGEVGHLNPASGYGPWPEALELIRQLAEPPTPPHP
ncbi:RBBP9/YdeN family alpha/beta hydrolase [Nocardia africana]|uniref:RBBP9/YdeN family alpha/beta hydrolase n=1 Tax=Nocardia africana TaxID=134964 RepID=A0ABW6NQW0_9NOCA